MVLKRHASSLESPFKRTSVRPRLPSRCPLCSYSTRMPREPKTIAIFGGGISGLSSAYFIAKRFPNTKITIYEAKERLGGWMQSQRVVLNKDSLNGQRILLEYGPRTLRTGILTLPTLQLIDDLGLLDDVRTTSREAAASQSRYILYPRNLVRLPSPGPPDFLLLWHLWVSGLLKGIPTLLMEPFRKGRPEDQRDKDESIADFVARRLGRDYRVADNLVSAVIHGIYAGDIYKLSAKAILPQIWHLERYYGSVLEGLARLRVGVKELTDRGIFCTALSRYDWDTINHMMRDMDLDLRVLERLSVRETATYTFKEGLQQLVTRLEDELRRKENVEILTQTRVSDYHLNANNQLEVTSSSKTSNGRNRTFDFAVSTLPNPSVAPAVTVMTVNLYYTNPQAIEKWRLGYTDREKSDGFGYLIPRSVDLKENPERALGVVFDHDATQNLDQVRGTKLTVMLGGHWWDGWREFPDEKEGETMAKSIVKRHLGITEEPDLCHVSLHENCIPQYTVGYEDRVRSEGSRLADLYKGRLWVTGNHYNGVGVNDCIRGAYLLAQDMENGGWLDDNHRIGLRKFYDSGEWFMGPNQFALERTLFGSELPKYELASLGQ
ncbi:Protoporphyrinogen oxidase [Westerdykella ornata]|uniref:Protoporphyrinogen oxidase n=1 Tax=Westerdykella ornata TaxID=318751 RepID=A0A6A6J755_WESOR|nr:Protoporphyrinogen oxidase [Westerdykella ornata]KAF2272242.1 Protoporphyrinogen oxidase [Westerdykella ornata]